MSSILDFQQVDDNGWPLVDEEGYPVLLEFNDRKSMKDVERVIAMEKPNAVIKRFAELYIKTIGFRWAKKYVRYLRAHDAWKVKNAEYLAAYDQWLSSGEGQEPQAPIEPQAPVLEQITVQDVAAAADPPDLLTKVVKVVKQNRSDIAEIKAQIVQ